jgi:hypothetical protein
MQTALPQPGSLWIAQHEVGAQGQTDAHSTRAASTQSASHTSVQHEA